MQALHIKSPLTKPLINLIGYIIPILVTIRYAIKKGKKQEGSSFKISFNKVPVWLFPVVIVSTVALVVLLERIASFVPMPVSVEKFFEKAFTKDFFSIITMVIAAPILEEIFCRGIVLSGLLKNYAPNKAILISAIFFAVIHMNPWQAVPAFFGGLFLGWVYHRTRSVIPGMVIHATINGTAAMLLFLPKNHQDFLSLFGAPYYIALCVVAVLTFSAGSLYHP